MPLDAGHRGLCPRAGRPLARRARRLVELLDLGAPLPVALDHCPGLLPRHALPTIRVGWQSGALAPALRQAATIENLQPVWTASFGKVNHLFLYLFFMPIFALGILTFLMLKIVPAFEKIFKDFDVPLPTRTQELVSFSYFGANLLPFLYGLLCLLGPIAVLYAAVRYFGWIQWDPPGIAGLVRRLDAANILDSLALVARQQRPMLDGVADLAAAYPKWNIRRRLNAAADDIRAGRDWCESLYRRGLIRRPDLAILQAAQRVGNLPWAMQEMAQSGRRRFAYRLQAIAQAAFPPVVIIFGLMVMFIVVALFLPLVALIQKLT